MGLVGGGVSGQGFSARLWVLLKEKQYINEVHYCIKLALLGINFLSS